MDLTVLKKYIPDSGIPFIEKWLSPYSFNLTIKNARKTKLGDYRKPVKGKPHEITVNGGMPQSLCFHVLTHEIAHLIAIDKNIFRINPHGEEWKKVFGTMILESIEVYEEDLRPIMIRFAINPKASFHADKHIYEYYYKLQNDGKTLLKEVNDLEFFKLNNLTFKKIKKLKTRYICKEIKTGKQFLISQFAPVDIIENNE